MTDTFNKFWSLYPRKAAKKAAKKVWDRMDKEEQEAAILSIPNHVKYWLSKGSEIEFIPHPRTWLNQGRWDDEIVFPKPVDTRPKIQWWQSDTETVRKGRELGLNPRPGETMYQFRERIMLSINNPSKLMDYRFRL